MTFLGHFFSDLSNPITTHSQIFKPRFLKMCASVLPLISYKTLNYDKITLKGTHEL